MYILLYTTSAIGLYYPTIIYPQYKVSLLCSILCSQSTSAAASASASASAASCG